MLIKTSKTAGRRRRRSRTEQAGRTNGNKNQKNKPKGRAQGRRCEGKPRKKGRRLRKEGEPRGPGRKSFDKNADKILKEDPRREKHQTRRGTGEQEGLEVDKCEKGPEDEKTEEGVEGRKEIQYGGPDRRSLELGSSKEEREVAKIVVVQIEIAKIDKIGARSTAGSTAGIIIIFITARPVITARPGLLLPLGALSTPMRFGPPGTEFAPMVIMAAEVFHKVAVTFSFLSG